MAPFLSNSCEMHHKTVVILGGKLLGRRRLFFHRKAIFKPVTIPDHRHRANCAPPLSCPWPE
jgi:hypothetical protein